MQRLWSTSWEALSWLHDMEWYRDLMRAEWFRPLRPTWERYRLDWVLVGLALALLLLLLYALGRRLLRSSGIGERSARRLALQTGEQLLAQGELLLAAGAFQNAGEPQRAIQILEAAGAFAQAGELAERSGDLDLAARLYQQGKDDTSLLRVLIRAGKVDTAVESLRNRGRLPDAAELLLAQGRVLEAARLFDAAGLHTRAAELFRQAGEGLLAAESLLKLMRAGHGGFTADEVEMLLEGAAALLRAGRWRESAEMLLAAGELEGAAQRFEKMGDAVRAAECYERAGKLARAAALCPDPVRRLELLERMRAQGQQVSEQEWAAALAAAGRSDRAAAELRAQGDIGAAAEVLRQAGDLAGAAALLAGSDRHLAAARMFEEAGDLRAAEEQFLLGGAKRDAARMALLAGRCLEAGRLLVELDALPQAVEALQQVPAEDAGHREALGLLARAFEALGDASMARRTHARAVEGLALAPAHLGLFYQQALFLEGTGLPEDLGQARSLYERILDVDYGYRDVRLRLESLGRKGRPSL